MLTMELTTSWALLFTLLLVLIQACMNEIK